MDCMSNHVLLDNQAQSSVFGNKALLKDLVDRDVPHRYNGIGGGSVLLTQTGSFCDKEGIDYAPNSEVNILSWSQMIEAGVEISFNSKLNLFKMQTEKETLVFKPYNGLYALRLNSTVMVTKSEQLQAKMAFEIQRRLAYPAKSGVEHFVNSGAMANVPIGSKALKLVKEAIPHIQGKSTRKAMVYGAEIIKDTTQDKSSAIHCDLFFLKPLIAKEDKKAEKTTFILSVSDFGLSIVKVLKTKGLSEVTKGLSDVLQIYCSHGWKITRVHSDGEYNFENALEKIANAPLHRPRGAGNHAGRVEERVRRIKDNVRALQAGLQFRMGQPMLVWATYYLTYVLNLMLKREGDGVCPRQILTGIKPDFKRSLPVGFGDFCQVLERDTNNTLKARTVTALALLPTGNGPVKFASLSTGKSLTREQFKIIQNVPYELLIIVKTMHERGMLGIEDLLQPNVQVEDENELIVSEAQPEDSGLTILVRDRIHTVRRSRVKMIQRTPKLN